MKQPLVSVIIPVYNTGKSAKTLVEKLLHDSYTPLEIILIDDGSTDDSFITLKSLKSKNLTLLHQPNSGPSSARNLGIARAKGDYLFFIDSDDDIAPDFIAKLVAAQTKPHTALVSSGYLYHHLSDGSNKPVAITPFIKRPYESRKAFILRALLNGRLYAVNNKIFDAETIRHNKLRFDEAISFAEDTKFVLDYLAINDGDIRFIQEPLYIYNYGTSTSIASHANQDWQKWETSFQNLKIWLGSSPTLRERVLLSMIRLRWRIACLRAKRRAKR